jgi:hypothetical protein
VRGFDFLIGKSPVHHQRRKVRLSGSQEWERFEGTTQARKIMGGQGIMDDNVLDLPGHPDRAIALRPLMRRRVIGPSGGWMGAYRELR